jgi:murein DD-endopeptidase MepM/ murein hydrolase activator NlpD
VSDAALRVAAHTGKACDAAHTAAKQLEAFFLRQVLSEARASGGGALDGGFAGDTFKQMLDEAVADKVSSAGGVGMAEMMAQQLQGHAAPPASGGRLPAVGLRPESAYAGNAVDAVGTLPNGAPRLIVPVVGTPTSGFGTRIVNHAEQNHPGFDLAAATGTPVVAAAGGKVTHAGPGGTYGNLVIVRHGNGYETRYAHLSAVTVKVGDEVPAGQQVGNVGTTGYSTGPHLHFEVRHDGTPIDPAPLLPLGPLNRSRVRTSR